MVKFRLTDFFHPWLICRWRRVLWKSQYYSNDKLRSLQWKLLSGLLDHCFDNVPYYRALFSRLGLRRSDFAGLEDLSAVPILHKDVLLEKHEEFKADNFERFKPRLAHTSGTTGTPLRVYWDRASNVLELVCQWRHFSWAGYRLGQSFLDIRSRVLDVPDGYLWNRMCRGLEVSSIDIDESNIERYARLFRKYRIRLWRGHPGAIELLCRFLRDAGIEDVKPRYVITCAEPLLGYQRKSIESWTGVTVCEDYGLMEHNALICQCPAGGYHIAPEYGIVEIIRDDGNPADPGEEGRIIATGLHNKAFVLLRYDTGDYAVRSDEKCACGRTLPLVERFTGRIDDRVLRADGRWVSGLSFVFYHTTGLRAAQLVQQRRGSLDVYLVPADDFSEQTESHVRRELIRTLGESMEINIRRVDEIPFPSPGKSKLVISELNSRDVP
ncbi:MAG: phenylacetate--CoA ligase family protein [Sedimentisphaerales bacterium]|nr:phenylacetate--CoA ligase family protein [Sedimentisphaerales bacterium]